jgi:putative sigma-54 modulation protein
MKTQIQSIHFDADNKLLDLIQDKVVEINMNIPGKRLFTKNQSNKFEVAADMAIDDIKKQLNLHKNKIADRNSLGIEILQ